jgi:hypothetical protein
MSAIVEKIEKLDRSVLEKFYRKKLSGDELAKLENQLNLSIDQNKSRVKGSWLTDMEDEDGNFRMTMGMGMRYSTKKQVYSKQPYVAVTYLPKWTNLQSEEKGVKASRYIREYLKKKAKATFPVLGIPVRILEEANAASHVGIPFTYVAEKTAYKIPDEYTVIYTLSPYGIGFQIYFEGNKIQDALSLLKEIAKKFESFF